MSNRPFVALPVLLAACVSTAPLGPDLGACAAVPDGVYTYGQLGIGTCLAGPADLQFRVTDDGRTQLLVTNADPFRIFTGGSLLAIDVASLDLSRERQTMDQLDATALPTESFIGRFALLDGGNTAVLASRLSDGSYLRGTADRVWLANLSAPDAPAWQPRPFLPVGADPFAVVADPDQRRAYVLNATSNSVSVVDARRPDAIDLLDPAPESRVTSPVWTPTAGSTGIAELRTALVSGDEIPRPEQWTVTWVDGSTRLWAHEGTGLVRWTSGGVDWTRSKVGVELDPDVVGLDEATDPWVISTNDGLLAFFASGGRLRGALTEGNAADWILASTEILSSPAWAIVQGGPSLVEVSGRGTLYFDGRTAQGEPGSIGIAGTPDGVAWSARAEPVISPTAELPDLAQPSALVDLDSATVRVWMSAWDGSRWVVALADSVDDGLNFGAPEVVLTRDAGHASAPVVVQTGGQYRMWLTIDVDGAWWHAESWSWDGRTWSEPVPVVPALDVDVLDLTSPPPRAAIQHIGQQTWRVAGVDAGTLSTPAVAGEAFEPNNRGFALAVSSGFVVGTSVGVDLDQGLEPGSLAVTGPVRTLYATGWNADGRPRLLALRQVGDRWGMTSDDLVPAGSGGNSDGARSPVVFATDGGYTMLYAAGKDGRATVRRATSTDGVTWTAAGGDVLPSAEGWEAAEQLPHAVTAEGDNLVLWYGGSDGRRTRIGQAVSTDGGATWKRRAGRDDDWVFGTGDPGAFDDSGVRDAAVRVTGDRTQLWYSGFDGDTWSLGYAERTGTGAWVRHVRPLNGVAGPVLDGTARTFDALGVRSPVLDGDRLWYAGTDGLAWRIGEASVRDAEVHPRQRVPSPGDTFVFDTLPGEPGRSAIRLGRQVDRLLLPGASGGPATDGPTSAALDSTSGLLWVVSGDFPGLIAVDVRDDSTATFQDRNYLDIEAAVRITTTTGLLGFQDILRAPSGLLYLAATQPDGVLVIDPAAVLDDAEDQVIDAVTLGVLPMHDATDDDGEETFAAVGAAGMALVPDQNLLLVTHFRDNSLSVFDLSLGTVGEEIRHVEDVGENPSIVRVSPDGTWAVIANYLGEANGDSADSSLAILDLQPTSPTYLQIVTRIVNR